GSNCSGSCDFVLLRYQNTDGVSGIPESNSKNNIKLFPNPNRGEFILEVTEPGIIEITDFTGRIISSHETKVGVNRLSENIPAGIYFIHDKINNAIQKLIIQ
ncbi:MAG TPA: T9SS type A sorting domain-containing protein, partial [Bacteroidia bacterium]|nr:T9SS type A sorting domain-containing protein [Bacteroidia bacterium]